MALLAFGTYTFPNATFEVEGLGMDMRLDTGEIPRRPGTRITAAKVGPRSVRVTGKIHSPTAGTVWSDMNILLRTLSAMGEQPLAYRDGYVLDCWFSKAGHAFAKGANPTVGDLKIDFACDNPLPRAATITTTMLNVTSVLATALTVNVGGYAETGPKFIIVAGAGPAAAGLQISHGARGELGQFISAVPAGSTLIIDADRMTVELAGVNYVKDFEGSFPQLNPGQNVLTLTGATYMMYVEHYDRAYA